MELFTLVTIVLGLLSVPTILGVQRAQERRQKRETQEQADGQSRATRRENKRQARARAREQRRARIRENPDDAVFRGRVQMDADLCLRRLGLKAAEEQVSDDKAALEAMPAAAHTGVQLYVRLAVLAVLSVVVAAGVVLAIETFVALNNGHGGAAPVLKGVLAAAVELLAGFALTRLLHGGAHRWNDVGWVVQLVATTTVLILIVGYLAAYSPQRSAQKYGPLVDDDRRALQAAQSNHVGPVVVTAARDKLANDSARMNRAEYSDAALAIAVPVVEILSVGLAMEGFMEVLLIRRRRQAQERVRTSKTLAARLRGDVAVGEDTATARAVAVLGDAGVTDLRGRFANNGGPAPATPGGSPAASAQSGPAAPTPPPARSTAPPPVPPTAPAGGGAPINLDGFAPPPNTQFGAGPEWDVAGQV